ncbi:hypothetical protein ACIO3S_24615 [Nocardioides sp. NPDC087217]|uniref:hypothetical protein n=1 Tax=Nocardioides sp. NPDC087217 TaxID=3364335 RepID=UPI003830EFAB
MAYRRVMADLLGSTPGLSSNQLAAVEGGLGPMTAARWVEAHGTRGPVGDAETGELRRFVLRSGTEMPGNVAIPLAMKLLELGRVQERDDDRLLATELVKVRDCVEMADPLLPEVGRVHEHLDRLTVALVGRADDVDARLIGAVLRRRLDPAGLPRDVGELPGFTVATVLEDAEKAARESLHSAVGWYAPSMLQSLIPTAHVALDLIDAHGDTSDLRKQLGNIERSWAQGSWPTNRDLRHPAMTLAGRSLKDASALLAMDPAETLRSNPAIRHYVLQTLHVATYATRSAVTSYIGAERELRAPGPAIGEEGQRWIRRLDTFEQLVGAKVTPRAAVAEPARTVSRPTDHERLRTDLDAWTTAVEQAVGRRASPASLALIAQVQAMTIETGVRLVRAADIARDPGSPAVGSRSFLRTCDHARTAWRDLAVRWTAVAARRPTLDHAVSDAAIALRESCSHLTRDGRRLAEPVDVATRPDVPQAAVALLRSFVSAQYIAVDLQRAVLDPHLNGGMDAPANTGIFPRATRRPHTVGPPDVRRDLASATAEVVRRSVFLASAVHKRLDSPPAPAPADAGSHVLQQAFLGAPLPASAPPRIPAAEPVAAPAR